MLKWFLIPILNVNILIHFIVSDLSPLASSSRSLFAQREMLPALDRAGCSPSPSFAVFLPAFHR